MLNDPYNPPTPSDAVLTSLAASISTIAPNSRTHSCMMQYDLENRFTLLELMVAANHSILGPPPPQPAIIAHSQVMVYGTTMGLHEIRGTSCLNRELTQRDATAPTPYFGYKKKSILRSTTHRQTSYGYVMLP
ncbi:hypothetical protein CASFOL_030650 [Castilleja foliolosa]|uniref:Uncharacterized protein n=1 Tax=Castilleja foliolosa TaxID=1961234 RepID=A0ABD3C7U0_9LAMI